MTVKQGRFRDIFLLRNFKSYVCITVTFQHSDCKWNEWMLKKIAYWESYKLSLTVVPKASLLFKKWAFDSPAARYSPRYSPWVHQLD